MDLFLKLLSVLFLGLISLSFCSCVLQLQNIQKEIRHSSNSISSNISHQTVQQSWLVSHYMKPVRGLYPWDPYKCEYCGCVQKEMDMDTIK
jgi:hypothetical protein